MKRKAVAIIAIALCLAMLTVSFPSLPPQTIAVNARVSGSSGYQTSANHRSSPTPTATPTPSPTPKPTPAQPSATSSPAPQQPSPSQTTGLKVVGNQIEDAYGNTVVLRGVNYDSGRFYDEGNWNTNQMAYIKAMGCNAVCIKVCWWDLPGIYSESGFWTTLDSMMASAQSNGLYVIFSGFGMAGYSLASCGFWTSSWLNEWATISQRYAKYSNIIYEPIAEYLSWTYATYQTNMQNVIDVIRTYSPNAIIAVQATGTGNGNWPATFSFETSNPINRPNIIFSCDPYGFFTYPDNSQSAIWNDLSSMINFNAVKGYPIFFTEFGGNDDSSYSSWSITWVTNFMTAMDSHGCAGYCAWRWCTATDDPPYAILTDWNGHLSTFGNNLKNYYSTH